MWIWQVYTARYFGGFVWRVNMAGQMGAFIQKI
jgi:hypothetical protein